MVTLQDDQVQVWFASLDVDNRIYLAAANVLSSEELNRASHILDPRERRRYVVCRGILRSILAKYVGSRPELIGIESGVGGKPFLHVDAQPSFNVTHSHGNALLAFSKGHEIGIDLEVIGSMKESSRLAGRILSEQTGRRILRLPDNRKSRFLYKAWTEEEALLKAMGKGLSAFHSISMNTLRREGKPFLVKDNSTRKVSKWHLHDLDVGDKMVASLVVEGISCELRTIRFLSPNPRRHQLSEMLQS